MKTIDICNNMLEEAGLPRLFKQKSILILLNNRILCTIFNNQEMIETTKYMLTNGRTLI